ncbi:MAG: radical SAM family heme chaperone HemW [Zoogloeaceae bacterium]|jgi:oxygen-independent coproporphyrinogen-3 oxidase|nr:radical SAM family heme chaperone HemW [Zoogloeaceae bacterium]
MTHRVIPVIAENGNGATRRLSSLPPLSPLPPLPPLSLYVHFPWCVRKCPYCDFNSHEVRERIPEARYLAALIADLEQSLPLVWGRPVTSVFFGGGTPSLLTPEAVDALLGAARARLPLLPDAEITLEANPGATEADRFAGYRAAGVNRLSVGVQSFNPRHLAALGRIHDANEARRAVALALQHFDNVNLDLMYALPAQTLAEAQADISEAADCGAPHLSVYHLTLEPNTAFHRAPPPLPDADLAARMQDAVEETLAARGYVHYETSAFARAGHACRHNLNYWLFGDYLGIGAGAHGKISSPAHITRQMKHKHPQTYMEHAERGAAAQTQHTVGVDDLPFEFMMNALRLTDGFPAHLFTERTGRALETIRPQLDEAVSRGLLEMTATRIAPSGRGQRFLNDLLQIFLPD